MRTEKEHNNFAARELWEQIFARQVGNPAAAILDPDYDGSADRERCHAALRMAGWSEELIAEVDAAHSARIAVAPTTSPGVNRAVEAQYAMLADTVEAAMVSLGYDPQGEVARGVEPRVGPYAAKINVMLTNESIIVVGAFLFRYCGLIARAFTRTLRLDPWLWESDGYDEKAARRLLASNSDLLLYWMRIYISFALSGTHLHVPYLPSAIDEVMLMEQVARAMEIFAVAHEYGHHHLDHGRRLGGDSRAEEFAADAFALRISDEVEKRPVLIENPYLLSGAGALILLMSLDTLRAIEEIMGARCCDMGTHPSVAERTERFESIRMLSPDEHRWLKGFRTASLRVMTLVHGMLVPSLASMPPDELKAFRHQRTEFERWKNLDG